MERLARLPCYVLVVSAIALASGCREERKGNTITDADAAAFMSSYVSTLRSGDTEAIKKYWAPASLNRKGFDVMHLWVRGLIHISEWKSFLDSTQYSYRVKELVDRDGYCVINGEWTKDNHDPARGESHPMPFYLVREGDSWLLINPIDVLTRDWRRYETASMVFFYREGIDIGDHLREIQSLDEQCQVMCRAMDYSHDGKIEYYKASSPEECGRLLTQGSFNGLAAVTYADSIKWFQIAVSTAFYNPHEVMHIIALSSGVPYGNSFLSEGLAVAYGGTTFQASQFAHNYCRIMMESPRYVPIKRLVTMGGADFLQASDITYQEAGSFIRYLVDTYGMARLRNLIACASTGGDLGAGIVRVYGATLDDLEGEWKEYLRQIELPRLSFSVPDTAEAVFGMTDPEGDDEGDGDYRYPANEGYVKGCFDLTKFEVFKDGARIYFKIGLGRVIEPVSNRPGGAKFIPAVVVAVNKGGGSKRHLCRYTNDVEARAGYDLKINVGFGVNVSDSLGRVFVSTGDAYGQMADVKANTLTFSLPIGLIGEPDDGWRYFVGVGLTNEPVFNFSGLVPVFKSEVGLIHGGNCDYSNPAFIDVLLPESIDQAGMLADYDSEQGRFAIVRMVSSDGETF